MIFSNSFWVTGITAVLIFTAMTFNHEANAGMERNGKALTIVSAQHTRLRLGSSDTTSLRLAIVDQEASAPDSEDGAELRGKKPPLEIDPLPSGNTIAGYALTIPGLTFTVLGFIQYREDLDKAKTADDGIGQTASKLRLGGEGLIILLGIGLTVPGIYFLYKAYFIDDEQPSENKKSSWRPLPLVLTSNGLAVRMTF